MAASGLCMCVHKDAHSLIHTCENTCTCIPHITQIKPTVILKKKLKFLSLSKYCQFQRDSVFGFSKFAVDFLLSSYFTHVQKLKDGISKPLQVIKRGEVLTHAGVAGLGWPWKLHDVWKGQRRPRRPHSVHFRFL